MVQFFPSGHLIGYLCVGLCVRALKLGFLVPTATLCHTIQCTFKRDPWPSLSFPCKLPHAVKTTTEKALLICKVRDPKHIW